MFVYKLLLEFHKIWDITNSLIIRNTLSNSTSRDSAARRLFCTLLHLPPAVLFFVPGSRLIRQHPEHPFLIHVNRMQKTGYPAP